MKHKEKLSLARRMVKVKLNKGDSVFSSSEWEDRKQAIANRVKRKEAIAHKRALERKKNKLKIIDDKGKEHKVGEIFESKTLILET